MKKSTLDLWQVSVYVRVSIQVGFSFLEFGASLVIGTENFGMYFSWQSDESWGINTRLGGVCNLFVWMGSANMLLGLAFFVSSSGLIAPVLKHMECIRGAEMNSWRRYPVSWLVGTVSIIKLDERLSKAMMVTTDTGRPMRELNILDLFSKARNEMSISINSSGSVDFGRRVSRELCQFTMLTISCWSVRYMAKPIFECFVRMFCKASSA